MEENWNLDIDSYQKRFCTCDGATLADKDLPPTKYVIRKLLPQGLALLSGSPKVGNFTSVWRIPNRACRKDC